jgi:deoxycytidylate deaminase
VSRPSFDEVAFNIAKTIAQRSTCPRLHTGAVIATLDNRVLCTGYNGSLPSTPHCDEVLETLICATCNGSRGITIPLERNEGRYYGVNNEDYKRGIRRIMCPDCQNDPFNTRATGKHEVLPRLLNDRRTL